MTNKRAAEVLSMAVTFNGCGRCTGDEMREAVKMACATLEATEWISVKNRVPNSPRTVLVTDGYDVQLAFYTKNFHILDSWYHDLIVKYWMEIPEPPKEDA